MKNHIPDPDLEQFILNAKSLSGSLKEEIEQHLADCSWCRNKRETLENYYSLLEKNIDQPLTDREKKIASSLYSSMKKKKKRVTEGRGGESEDPEQ